MLGFSSNFCPSVGNEIRRLRSLCLLKTPKGRESLEIFAQRRTVVGMITILSAIGVRDQERAETILLRLDGVGVEAVAERLKTSPKRVSLWSRRFETSGHEGLDDKPGRGRNAKRSNARSLGFRSYPNAHARLCAAWHNHVVCSPRPIDVSYFDADLSTAGACFAVRRLGEVKVLTGFWQSGSGQASELWATTKADFCATRSKEALAICLHEAVEEATAETGKLETNKERQ